MKLLPRPVLFLTGLLFSLHSSGQGWLWVKQIGNAGFLSSPSSGEVYAIAADNAGNVYETGSTVFLNAETPTAYLVKYDAIGNPLWATQGVLYTEHDESKGNAVAVDNDGNVYITGFFQDSVTFGSVTLAANPGQQQEDFLDAFLVKYNSNGIVQWAKQSTTTQYNAYRTEGLGLTCDHAGNIYVTGEFGNTITFGTDSLNIPTGGYGDVFLVKYDANGNVLWLEGGHLPSGFSSAQGNAVTVDASDNVYITGTFYDTIAFGSQTLVSRSVAGDIFIAKFTGNSVPVWAKQTTNSSSVSSDNGPISGNGLTTDRAGNVYLAGNFEDTIYFDSVELINPIPYLQYSYPYGDMLITKYDPNGNVIWAKAGEPFVNASYAGWSVVCDTFNHLYYLGTAANFYSGAQLNYVLKFGTDTFSTGGNPPSWEGSFVIEFDTSGNVLCGNGMPLGGDDLGGIATDPSGRYLYMGEDYRGQFTVVIANDSINPIPSEEVPFIARWSPCMVLLLVSTNQVNVTCNGLCNGQVTAEPEGGIPPYKYSWNTLHLDTTRSVTGLCAGTYTVVVTDNAGITTSSVVTITQPPVFKVSASPDTSICKGHSVILNTAISGGTSPFTYTWFPYAGLNDTTNAQVMASPANSTTYSVTVTDTSNCMASATVAVNINAVLPPGVVTTDSLICSGDSTQVCAEGFFSSYIWNTGATGLCIEVNSGGGYWATVTNANGCTAVSGHQNISVFPVTSVSIIVQGDTLSSFGAVSYQWLFDDSIISGAISPAYVAHKTGNYAVQVTDSNGCTALSAYTNVTVTGILDPYAAEMLSIYPNPFDNIIFIKPQQPTSMENVTVYDETGRIVLNRNVNVTLNQLELDASALSNGVYYIKIKTRQGEFCQTVVKIGM